MRGCAAVCCMAGMVASVVIAFAFPPLGIVLFVVNAACLAINLK